MKRRILSIILISAVIAALFAGMPLNSSALYVGGESGECIWTLSDSTLTISPGLSGGGRMADYDSNNAPAYADYWQYVKRIVVESGVTHIGDMAFIYSAAESVTLPDGLTSIGACAFARSDTLRSIVIPDSVTSISKEAFLECRALESVTLSKGLTIISPYLFYGCSKLNSVVIPESVTGIGKFAFAYTGLRSVEFPMGLSQIGDKAFLSCPNLFSVVVPPSVTKIGVYALGYLGSSVNPSYTIYGKGASHAQVYANGNGIKFSLYVFPVTYTVTYNANGGSGEMPSCTVAQNATIRLPECAFTPPAGYEFSYWLVNRKRYEAGGYAAITDDTDILAIWKESGNSYYAVTFDAGIDGSGTMNAVPVVSGGTFTFPECLFQAPEGKKFKCWMSMRVYYNPGDTMTVTSNRTATAIWEDVTVQQIGTVRVGGTPVAIVGQSAADNPPDCFSRLYNSVIVSSCWKTKTVMSGRTYYVDFTGTFEAGVEYYPSFTCAPIGDEFAFNDIVTVVFDDGREVLVSVNSNGEIAVVGSAVIAISAMKGDLDKDGEITVADALKALRIAAKLVSATGEDIAIGDVDGDGDITVADALKILRVAAKLANRSSLG